MTRGFAVAASLALLIAASLLTGAGRMPVAGLLDDPDAWRIFVASRLPRTAAALLTGASMAVAGQIMQMLARNRFIEPTTAGTGQSAALGIVLATLFAPGAGVVATMAAASLAALVGTAGFILMIRRLPVTQPLLVPVVGLVYGAVIGAAATWLAYQTDLLQYLGVWMNGEFSGVVRGRYEMLWATGACALLAYLVADQFTIVGLGRDAAMNLGLNYRQVVSFGLAAVALITALTVSTVGMIPFIGLVAPNVIRRLMGDNLRATLPYVALLGAMLVLAGDLLGRLLIHPYEVPAGTVVGVVGALVFLWLLLARPARAE